jgi:hypothetical protein
MLFTHLDLHCYRSSLFTLALAIELIISDHRLTSVRQLDLQEAGKLTLKFSSHLNAKKIFYKVKVKFEIDRVNFFKSKQIFQKRRASKLFRSKNDNNIFCQKFKVNRNLIKYETALSIVIQKFNQN